MKFFATLRWPLWIWQIFGMAPFVAVNKSLLPAKNTNLQYYACSLLLVQLILLTIGVIFPTIYTDFSSRTITNYDDFLAMFTIRLAACTIIAEAILKLNKQIEFLQQINRVDQILRRKLQIEIDYKNEQIQNNIFTVIWILTCFSCVICVLVIFLQLNAPMVVRYWLFYTLSFPLCSIHYHRLVLYVHLILRRYKIVNRFIEDVCLQQEKRADNFELLLALKKVPKVTFADYPPSITMSQLVDIRNVYQILYETTDMINDMCRWSLPLCIAIDFHRLLVNSFYIFSILLLQKDWNTLIVGIFWGGINVGHLLLLSHACHCTAKEVSLFSRTNLSSIMNAIFQAAMTSALLHNIDLFHFDEEFCEMVSYSIFKCF